MRQGLIGGLLLSPGLHFFLTRVMAKLAFPASFSNFSRIGMRVAVHQACMMPFIQFSLLFVSGMLQPAKNWEARIETGTKRFEDKWRMGFAASLMYWPLVNSVMYSMVQPRFMNLYADVCALFFASVMSYITYNDCKIDPAKTLSAVSTSTANFAAKGTAGLTQVASYLKQTNQMHLNALLNDSRRVEA